MINRKTQNPRIVTPSGVRASATLSAERGSSTGSVAKQLCWKFLRGQVTFLKLVNLRESKWWDMAILHGHQFDLTRRSTRQFLIRFLASGTISYCHFGTPCTVFSTARQGIRNFTRARLKERISCELAFFTIKLIEICLALGISWSIENPLTSALWELFPSKSF